MHEHISEPVVDRQLLVLSKAGKMNVVVQSEIRNQTTEISLKRPVTQEYKIPPRIPIADR